LLCSDSKKLKGSFMSLKSIHFFLLLSLVACKGDEFFSQSERQRIPTTRQESLRLTSESFVQTTSQKSVDILWVIDNSASMRNEQLGLAQNFDAFIRDFIEKEIDFKMAVITTDASSDKKCGKIIADSDKKLNSTQARENEARFLQNFSRIVQVGLKGSSKEKGLDSVLCFGDKYASEFLRSEAYFIVVILSDEEDQSQVWPIEFSETLKGYKSKPGFVKVHSLVNITEGDGSETSQTNGYRRYAEASNHTGGIVQDINSHFASSLFSISEHVMGLLSSFPLKAEPVVNTIKVKVNGKFVSSAQYKVENRSIKFLPRFVPQAGSKIEIEYQYKDMSKFEA
jgi:hypothetical protein